MISRIAWRNISRNKRRSFILIVSIIVGVMAMFLTDAFSIGMMRQMLTNQIGADAGYIQIHKKGYQSNPALKNSMDNPGEVTSSMADELRQCNMSERLRTFGLVSSASNSSGVSILGIEPASERKVTTLYKCIVQRELSLRPARRDNH